MDPGADFVGLGLFYGVRHPRSTMYMPAADEGLDSTSSALQNGGPRSKAVSYDIRYSLTWCACRRLSVVDFPSHNTLLQVV